MARFSTSWLLTALAVVGLAVLCQHAASEEDAAHTLRKRRAARFALRYNPRFDTHCKILGLFGHAMPYRSMFSGTCDRRCVNVSRSLTTPPITVLAWLYALFADSFGATNRFYSTGRATSGPDEVAANKDAAAITTSKQAASADRCHTHR
jgi:hypothetical protein